MCSIYKGLLGFLLLSSFIDLRAQNCDVAFPGTSTLSYSAECSNDPTISDMKLGEGTAFGDNDTFTFDSPATITNSGSILVKANGSGKIIIPAGVTINVSGSFQLDQDGGCDSGSPCTFEIEVNGSLNISGNLQNNLEDLIWSGLGTVDVTGNFENSSNGCMSCGVSTCLAFPSGSGCSDSGTGCSIDFCTDGNYGNGNALPVDLISFDGFYQQGQGQVTLNWATATEINNDYFTIEKSDNGRDFQEIGTIEGSGSTQETKYYQFDDLNPISPITYYRLTQPDFDGKFEIFPAIFVSVTVNDLRVYPTKLSVNSSFTINSEMFHETDSPLQLDIFDLSGRTLHHYTLQKSSSNKLALSHLQSIGMYILKINGVFETKLLVR